jgi:CubicO group peptidase (beta-lactamase class C family)
MSYKTSHSLFELICSKLFATMVLSGILLASTISGANSILAAPSHVSPTSTPLNPISKPGPAKGVDTFIISDKLKEAIKSHIDNGSNAAIVIGLVDPNGTQFYGYGKMSTANPTTADKNTVFDIGSITKSFTTLLWPIWQIVEQLI